MQAATYELHDTILETMSPYGCELKNGFSNHTPMVVEALAAMGEGKAAQVWFEPRKQTIKLRPVSQTDITTDNWTEALGDAGRFTDWANFFAEQINQRGWHAAVARWVPHLAPGLMSAACHGIIRVGHAVRALKAADTAPRRRELAYALAAWCSDYMELKPDSPQAIDFGTYNGNEILQTLPLLDVSVRKNDGAITTAVLQLRSHGSFFAATTRLRLGDLGPALLQLAQTAVDVFLHNARSPLGAIVFTHAITSVAAAGHILPHLTPSQQRQLLYQGFVAMAALHCVYATKPLANHYRDTHSSPENLIQQAVSHGDDHVIKLTESCTQFYRVTQNPGFLIAADLGASLIPAHE